MLRGGAGSAEFGPQDSSGLRHRSVAVLRRLEAQGLRNVTLNPPPHLVRQQVDEYADKIAPLLRQSAS